MHDPFKFHFFGALLKWEGITPQAFSQRAWVVWDEGGLDGYNDKSTAWQGIIMQALILIFICGPTLPL